MGQRFTTYFFELPGHGESSPFPVPFSSELIGAMLEEFMDKLEYPTVSIMGFSFGGILALKALRHLENRVEKVVLISPYVSRSALQYSHLQLWGVRKMASIVRKPAVRQSLLGLIYREPIGNQILRRVQRLSKVEETIPLGKRLREIPTSTLEVLVYQVNEILNTELPTSELSFGQPCYFAMSVYDPLLNFKITLDFLKKSFERVFVKQFTVPYHQPPEPLTFEGLVREYGHFLEMI
jgi:pimeloyl-ACP methyl ester carboxylesterase